MYNELATKLFNILKAEFDYIKTNETAKDERINKMSQIIQMEQIILNFDDLEPVLQKFFAEKAEKERFNK